MAELIPAADEAVWLEARRQGVTASEIAVIMGLSPWDSPYALYHRKLGILPGITDNAAMERGRVLEPYIREKFACAHDEYAVIGDGRQLYAHSERPWQMATLDALVHETEWHDRCNCGVGPAGYYGMHERDCGLELGAPVAVAEFKTASSMDDWGEPGTDEIPVHYRCQVLWQMDVMDVARAYVAVLDIPHWEIREYVIEHDDSAPLGYDVTHTVDATGELCGLCSDILMMRVAATEFLDRIEDRNAPDVDWRPATAYALKQLHPSLEDTEAVISRRLEISYRAAVKRFKDAEQRKDEMTNRLREAMGNARRAVATVNRPREERAVIATRQVYEVRESVRKAYTVDKIVAATPRQKEKKSVSTDGR